VQRLKQRIAQLERQTTSRLPGVLCGPGAEAPELLPAGTLVIIASHPREIYLAAMQAVAKVQRGDPLTEADLSRCWVCTLAELRACSRILPPGVRPAPGFASRLSGILPPTRPVPSVPAHAPLLLFV
jgi:hypothetical protein